MYSIAEISGRSYQIADIARAGRHKQIELSKKNERTVVISALESLKTLPLPKNIFNQPGPNLIQWLKKAQAFIKKPDQITTAKSLVQLAVEHLDACQQMQEFSDIAKQELAVFLSSLQLLTSLADHNKELKRVNGKLRHLISDPALTKLIKDKEVNGYLSDIQDVLFKENPRLSDRIKFKELETIMSSEEEVSGEDETLDEIEHDEVLDSLAKWHLYNVDIIVRQISNIQVAYNDGNGVYHCQNRDELLHEKTVLSDVRFFPGFGHLPVLGFGANSHQAGFLQLWSLTHLDMVQKAQIQSGQVIATSLNDEFRAAAVKKAAVVWNAVSGKKCLHLTHFKSRIYDIELISHFLCIASGKDVEIWDIKKGKQTAVLKGHYEPVVSIAGIRDYLITGSKDNTIRIWTYKDGKCVKKLNGHRSDVTAVQINENRVLISGDAAGQVKTWNGIYRSEEAIHQGWIQDLSMKGSFVASCAADDGIRVWDYKLKKELYRIEDEVERLHLFRDIKNKLYMITANLKGIVTVWRLYSKQPKIVSTFQICG
ncbi:hypothetical protein ACFL96_03980 [Thermoproteota archaeon]